MENSREGLQMLRSYNQSAKAFVLENFENPHVQAFILGWALAPQILPDQQGIGQTFYIMIPAIHIFGESIPKGGSMMLTTSLVRYLEANGGKVLTNASVVEFIVDSNKTAKGVRLADGTEIIARKAVVTSLDPKQTFLRLVNECHLNQGFLRMVRNFSFGTVSICRVHYALNEAPNFNDNPEINQTAFQRIFGSMGDIDKQYLEISGGVAPTDPFLWTACWTTTPSPGALAPLRRIA